MRALKDQIIHIERGEFAGRALVVSNTLSEQLLPCKMVECRCPCCGLSAQCAQWGNGEVYSPPVGWIFVIETDEWFCCLRCAVERRLA